MSEPTYTFAIWYLDDHGQIDYELAETEAEAAKLGAWADGDGTVLGLQRADGSTIKAAEWQALAEAKRRLRQAEQDQADNPTPRAPVRRAYDPFKGCALDIETDEPEWLGR